MSRAGHTTISKDDYPRELLENPCKAAWMIEFALDGLKGSPSGKTATRFMSIGYVRSNSIRDAICWSVTRIYFLHPDMNKKELEDFN